MYQSSALTIAGFSQQAKIQLSTAQRCPDGFSTSTAVQWVQPATPRVTFSFENGTPTV